jgi:hypothetical protein
VVAVFSSRIATWNARSGELTYLGKIYGFGDRIGIGGGSVNPAMIPAILRSDRVYVPADCPKSQLWFTAG